MDAAVAIRTSPKGHSETVSLPVHIHTAHGPAFGLLGTGYTAKSVGEISLGLGFEFF